MQYTYKGKRSESDQVARKDADLSLLPEGQEQYWQALLGLASEIENPPNGSRAVGEWLAKTAKITQTMRDGI
jgi:hypothetical protein